MNRRQYKNPPIEEALCEFHFADLPEWDPIMTPARLHEAYKERYPGKPRTQNIVTAGLSLGPKDESSVSMKTVQAKIQFPDSDGKRIVAVAPGRLSVHMLRPYAGWEDFRERITHALGVYRDIFNPLLVSQIGFRYINQITIPGNKIELQDFFRCAPPDVPGLPPDIIGFFHRMDHIFHDGVRLVLTFASTASQDQPVTTESHLPSFLLDLDLIWTSTDLNPPGSAMTVVDDLHTREREAFEASITDRSREIFDGN